MKKKKKKKNIYERMPKVGYHFVPRVTAGL